MKLARDGEKQTVTTTVGYYPTVVVTVCFSSRGRAVKFSRTEERMAKSQYQIHAWSITESGIFRRRLSSSAKVDRMVHVYELI